MPQDRERNERLIETLEAIREKVERGVPIGEELKKKLEVLRDEMQKQRKPKERDYGGRW